MRRARSLLKLTLLASLGWVGACAGVTPAASETMPTARLEREDREDPTVAFPDEPPSPPPPPPARPAQRAVTIGAGGDAIFHLKVIRSAHEHAAQGGFSHVLGALRDVIGDDEVAIANLETPLSERVPPETGDPPTLGAPPAVALALAAAGIDVVSVANNHSYDQTAAGMTDTLRALRDAEVLAVGAADEEATAPGPVIVERDGVRVAFVAFTERINRSPLAQGNYAHVARYDDALARAVLTSARARADVVVLSIHWSHDFIQTPRLAQRERARRLVDAGADLILGTGPHVLQEVERLASPRGEAVVAYSLGNLVSNQALRYRTGRSIPPDMHPAVVLPTLRDGAWLRVRFSIEGEAVRVERLEAVPLWTFNNYLDVALHREARLDVRVGPLRSMDEAVRAERRPVIEAALGPAVTLLP